MTDSVFVGNMRPVITALNAAIAGKATPTDVSNAIIAHVSESDPHGDRLAAETALAAHVVASDPHGDRAYADSKISVIQNELRATWSSINASQIVVPAQNISQYINSPATIKKVIILALGGSGSCVIDIWKTALGSWPPTSENSICGSSKPTISSGNHYIDSTLTGWTTAINANDTLLLNLQSSSVFTSITIFLVLG